MREDSAYYSSYGVPFPSIVSQSGISYCDKTYSINRPNSQFSTLEYVIEGSGTVCCDGFKSTVSKGDVYFLPSHTHQYYYSSEDDPWTKIFFNIKGEFANMLAIEYGLRGKYFFKDCDILPYMQKIFALAKSDHDPYEIQRRSLLLVHEIFMILCKHGENSKLSGEMNIMTDYIVKHISEPISLATLSKLIYRSKNHIINTFQTHLGCSPYEYCLRTKLEIACKMLSETNLSVQQIASELGFDNPHYFSSFFKKRMNITPLKYRENAVGNPIIFRRDL